MITRNTLGILTSITLVVGLWLSGCSSDPSTLQVVEDGELNLTDAYGGYSATSEAPGFGDSEILADDDSEAAQDEMAQSAVVDSFNQLRDRDIYSLELRWGQMQFDSTVTTMTDWSGSLTVERGAIVAARLIGFERGDRIVRPRDTCTVLEWVSQTGPHYDGILVFIYDPNPDSFAVANSVTFTTAPYTRTVTMSELESIDQLVDVGENQVSINGFLTASLECQQGFFQGRWMRQGDGSRGKFDGRWISSDGYLMGHIKGHFGIRDDGEHVLFGKWITLGGAFRGLLRGGWGTDSIDDVLRAPSGWFNGRWDDASGNRLGDFDGHWVAAPPTRGNVDNPGQSDRNLHRGHGFWRGQWAEICE